MVFILLKFTNYLVLGRNQILQVSDFSLKKFKFKKLSCIMIKVKEDT